MCKGTEFFFEKSIDDQVKFLHQITIRDIITGYVTKNMTFGQFLDNVRPSSDIDQLIDKTLP